MTTSDQTEIAEFQRKFHQQIPLTNHMGFERISFDKSTLTFELSLAPSHNDKGTAFAGALSAAANLCGWGAITLLLEQEPKAYDVVIRDSRLEYFLPVTRDFKIQAHLPEPETLDAFRLRLRERGKARLDLVVDLFEQGQQCFKFSGSYVALEKKQWL